MTENPITITKISSRSPLNPTVSQALKSLDAEIWMRAMDAEEKQFVDMEVYEIVNTCPSGVIPVRTHFVLKAVVDADGQVIKHKARLVANGKSQDLKTFAQVSSPTARSADVNLFIAVAAARGLPLVAYDVLGAYLHAKTSEAVSANRDPLIHILLPSGRIAKLKKFCTD